MPDWLWLTLVIGVIAVAVLGIYGLIAGLWLGFRDRKR